MAANPVSVVTGVSSGIGRAIAEELIHAGWNVIGLSRQPPEPPVPGLNWRRTDLVSNQDIDEAVVGIGNVRAIVHAAGLQLTAPLGALDDADGQEMWRVHVSAAVHLVNALADRIEEGGRILLIGSRTAQGAPMKSQYAATKSALIGLTRSWAIELAPRAITVNVLAPGPTKTPMLHHLGRQVTPPITPPLGRLVEPAEVAAFARFLLEGSGAMITGQHLVICGGASL